MCPPGELAAVSHLERSGSQGWGELHRLLRVCSSAFTKDRRFLVPSVAKNQFHRSETTPNLTKKDCGQGLRGRGIAPHHGDGSQTPAQL